MQEQWDAVPLVSGIRFLNLPHSLDEETGIRQGVCVIP